MGGEGADRFSFKTGWGTDTVKDFERGIDVVDLRQFFTSFQALDTDQDGVITAGDASFALNGGHLTFHTQAGDMFMLEGVHELLANEFLF